MSEELLQLRSSIDAIDEQIAQLLLKRQGFVHQVGELKQKSGDTGSFIRPDREAIMIRNVIKKFSGTDFNPAAAAQLWRIIIGAALVLESPLNVSVPSRHPAGLTLVREYFGNFIPATLRDDEAKIITDCLASPHTIGVVSVPSPVYGGGLGRGNTGSEDSPLLASPRKREEEQSNWWASLAQHAQLKVFAKLPFVTLPGDSISEEVYLIGQVKPAPTGEDETLFIQDGKLHPLAGFHPEKDGSIGAYAVPAKTT